MKIFAGNSTSMYVMPLLVSLALILSACSSEEKAEPSNETNGDTMRQSHAFATSIEKAHQMETWKKKGALKTDFQLNFGGSPMNANLFVETGGPGIRFEFSEDTLAIFDGKEMYAMPTDSAVNPFTLKTWAYFLKAAYKLNDPGTILEEQDHVVMDDNTFDSARLTFEAGTGDTPDDWYILYRNQNDNRLHAMVYIVTSGKTVEEANQNPHAISYEDYRMIEGVPVATTWKFWEWDNETGFSENPIGEATLSNIEFVSSGTLFTAPEGAKRMKR